MYRIIAAFLIALCFTSCDTRALSWDKVEDAVTEKTEDFRDSILRGEDDGISQWLIPEKEKIFDFLGEPLDIFITDEEIEICGKHGSAIIYSDEISNDAIEDVAEDTFRLEYTKENGNLISLFLIFRSGRKIDCTTIR